VPGTETDPTDAETVERRTPDAPVVLSDMATSLLEEAGRSGSSGTSATSLTPGTARTFTQTLVAVTGGNVLDPAHWNGPASLQVVEGVAAVREGERATELGPGEWTLLTDLTGTVAAEQDLVVLLTVAPGV
jgi:hypothetical protein